MPGEKLPPSDLALTVDDEPARRTWDGGQEESMGYREIREVARIRQELRECLMSDRFDGAGEWLARLRLLAEGEKGGVDLMSEYERWRVRFEILAESARNN